MKHVLGGMPFPELLMHSIHAESTCLLQGHQVRILTYLYKKKSFFNRFVLSIKSLNEKVILSKFREVYVKSKFRSYFSQFKDGEITFS